MKISVIATVKNEGTVIRPLFDSLKKQTRQPDEIVICDGGSSDNTVEVMNEYRQYLPLKIIIAPGSNISQGRNKAIKHAAGPIITSTDAGVVLSSDWVAELVRPIEEDGAQVVSGWFEPSPQTYFEFVLGATVLPTLEEIDPEKFLPSSRSVAFTKSAWQAVGGYPEWLDYSEDLIFDLALRRNYGSFARLLGRYVRDLRIMSLEEAVRKITHNAANILGIKDRGLIKEGMCADITVFDPNIVDAVGDYAEPRRYPKGIHYVIVNGKFAVDRGEHTGVLAGRFLRHEV